MVCDEVRIRIRQRSNFERFQHHLTYLHRLNAKAPISLLRLSRVKALPEHLSPCWRHLYPSQVQSKSPVSASPPTQTSYACETNFYTYSSRQIDMHIPISGSDLCFSQLDHRYRTVRTDHSRAVLTEYFITRVPFDYPSKTECFFQRLLLHIYYGY